MAEQSVPADDLGPAKVIQVNEPKSRLRVILVVDNVACGPAIGGLRMAPDVSLEECECAPLARAMTLKNAAVASRTAAANRCCSAIRAYNAPPRSG